MTPYRVILRAIHLLIPLLALACSPSLVETGPGRLADTLPLGRAIAEAGPRITHILFVHGMRAEGADTSAELLAGMADRLRKIGFVPDASAARNIPVDVGVWPVEASYAGKQIWRSQQEWESSRPFIQRHVLRRSDGAAVVLDEVNWWPLLFPLKCRFLLLPEAELAGADAAHLRLCARPTTDRAGWIAPAEAEAAIANRRPGGGGALVNRALKQQILNWGLSDAVIVLGPARAYIRRAMQNAFAAALPFEGRSAEEQDFTVISESLGSFVVLDALSAEVGIPGPVDIALDRSASLYFFANQIALLELGRLTGIEECNASSTDALRSTAGAEAPTPMSALTAWATTQSVRSGRATPRQIIAFSDPSDLLSWRVPEIESAIVVNVHDRNRRSLFGLIADPIAAHSGHSGNRRVLDLMFDK